MTIPLGLSVIGINNAIGLLFATALTLGVVPVLYSLLFRVRFEGFQHQ